MKTAAIVLLAALLVGCQPGLRQPNYSLMQQGAQMMHESLLLSPTPQHNSYGVTCRPVGYGGYSCW